MYSRAMKSMTTAIVGVMLALCACGTPGPGPGNPGHEREASRAADADGASAQYITLDAIKAYRAHLESAIAAVDADDMPGMLAEAEKAARLAPSHPRVMYVLAVAQALNGADDQALASIGRLARALLQRDLMVDPYFKTLHERPEFAQLVATMKGIGKTPGPSQVGFKLDDGHLLTEGIAHDARTGDFFISSVHKRKIVRRRADGTIGDLVAPRDDLLAVLAVHLQTDTLWACTAAAPEMKGYRPDLQGQSALVGFAVADGREIQRFAAPADGREHAFNDLTSGDDGTLYVSDSKSGAIYQLPKAATELQVLVPAGTLRSPQGLVLIDEGRALLVADYSNGIARIALTGDQRGQVLGFVPTPADTVTAGIDGLVGYDKGVIALQNGIRPHRLMYLQFDAGYTRIESAKVLEMGHPQLGEPTLGTIVDGHLYYIGNSQWASFAKGVPTIGDRPLILKLPLDS